MKRKIVLIFLLTQALIARSQGLCIDSIVAFYKNIDVDCYKNVIHTGMVQFDQWLQDTLPLYDHYPKSVKLIPFFTPSNIDIRQYDVIPFVALHFYKMDGYTEKDNIYDHLIIDSTLSVVLAPLNSKGKVIGLTDMAGERYSYESYTNKNDINYRHLYKPLRVLLKRCRKVKPDALVAFHDHWFLSFGYIKDRQIYVCKPKPVELNVVIQDLLVRLSPFNYVQKLDQISFPKYKDSFDSDGYIWHIKTGNTPLENVRMCPEIRRINLSTLEKKELKR